MNMKNLNKNGQALPLNTIVIAILVIIVLLVIIVFFTSKVGDSGSTIDDTTDTLTACEVGSYLISSEKYNDARFMALDQNGACSSSGYEKMNVIPKNKDGQSCCVQPK